MYWRITPLFQDDDKKVVEGTDVYIIHTPLRDLKVCILNGRSVSLEFAKQKEQELMRALGSDVIVTDRKVKWMKIEPMTPEEVATEMGKVPK